MRAGLCALLIAIVAGLIGCGSGDGGSGSTTRTFAGRTITVPTISTQSTRSTRTGTTSGTVPSTVTLPGGQTINTAQLTPFRNCLRRHGVQPLPLNSSSPPDFSHFTPQQRAQLAAQIRARVACASFLPSPLRERFEQARKRLQQRRQGR